MRFLRFIFFPFAILYWIITSIRNAFYEKEIMKSSKFSIPVINVGNLSMGGTGKTPHVEYLIRLLKDQYKVATLSRGFGRKERGFIIADETADANKIGDEPLQYYKKFGQEITVAVEADRVLGAMDLFREKPDIEVLILDDAFQHRKIFASMNILLTEYADPFYKDFILPVGNLRERRAGKKRADIIIITKCPELSVQQKKEIKFRVNALPHQKVFFSRISYGDVHTFSGDKVPVDGRNIILVTGIAKSGPLEKYLAKRCKILKHFKFGDHHNFKGPELEEIHKLFSNFASQDPVIVTTEKDAMRLMNETHQKSIENYPWTYQSIEIKIDEQAEFDQLIQKHVEKDN